MESYSPDSTEGLETVDSTSFSGVQTTNTPLTLSLGFSDNVPLQNIEMPELYKSQLGERNFVVQRTFGNVLSDCDDHLNSTTESPVTGSPTLLSPVFTTQVSESMFNDNTQMSLVERSADLHLEEKTVDKTAIWGVIHEDTDHEDVDSRKVLKKSRNCDASSTLNSCLNYEDEDEHKVFDAHLASNSTSFGFNDIFNNDVPELFKFSGKQTSADTIDSAPVQQGLKALQVEMPTSTSDNPDTVSIPNPSETSSAQTTAKTKQQALNTHFPSRSGGYELKVLIQPEDQHRARYMTEGSRGAVKDKSGNGYPTVKLSGYNHPVTLLVYIGSDAGKVKPHGFYQACKVCSKNATPCTERDIDGTTVIEMTLEPTDGMTATIDCVGILKLRNADVEQRIGVAKSKKKSTRARMVFRVSVPKPNGTMQTLQVASTSISCTQPAGQPEISKMSLSECSCRGGQELFIIGKNFLKGTKVLLREKKDEQVTWETEATYDSEYFQNNHMIVKVPPYHDLDLTEKKIVEIYVTCGGRKSEAVEIFYAPDFGDPADSEAAVKQEESSTPTTQLASDGSTGTRSCSPAALATNAVAPGIARQKLDFSEMSDTTVLQNQDVTPMETDSFKSKYVSPEAIALNKEFEKANRESNGLAVNANDVIDVEMSDSAKKRRTSSGKETISINECLSELQQMQDEVNGGEGAEHHHVAPQVSPSGSFTDQPSAGAANMGGAYGYGQEAVFTSPHGGVGSTLQSCSTTPAQQHDVAMKQDVGNHVASPHVEAAKQQPPTPQFVMTPQSTGFDTSQIVDSPNVPSQQNTRSHASQIESKVEPDQDASQHLAFMSLIDDVLKNHGNDSQVTSRFDTQQMPQINQSRDHSDVNDHFSHQIEDQIRLKQLQKQQKEEQMEKDIQQQLANHQRMKQLQEKELKEKVALEQMLKADVKDEDANNSTAIIPHQNLNQTAPNMALQGHAAYTQQPAPQHVMHHNQIMDQNQAPQPMHVSDQQTFDTASKFSAEPQVHATTQPSLTKQSSNPDLQVLQNTMTELLALLKSNQTLAKAQSDTQQKHKERLITSLQEQAHVLPMLANQTNEQASSNDFAPQLATLQPVQPQQTPVKDRSGVFTVTSSLPPTQVSSMVQQSKPTGPSSLATPTDTGALPVAFVPYNPTRMAHNSQTESRSGQSSAEQQHLSINDLASLVQGLQKGTISFAPSQFSNSSPHSAGSSQNLPIQQILTSDGTTKLVTKPLLIANPQAASQLLNIAGASDVESTPTLKQMLSTPPENGRSDPSKTGLLAHLLSEDKSDENEDAIFSGNPGGKQQPTTPVTVQHQAQTLHNHMQHLAHQSPLAAQQQIHSPLTQHQQIQSPLPQHQQLQSPLIQTQLQSSLGQQIGQQMAPLQIPSPVAPQIQSPVAPQQPMQSPMAPHQQIQSPLGQEKSLMPTQTIQPLQSPLQTQTMRTSPIQGKTAQEHQPMETNSQMWMPSNVCTSAAGQLPKLGGDEVAQALKMPKPE